MLDRIALYRAGVVLVILAVVAKAWSGDQVYANVFLGSAMVSLALLYALRPPSLQIDPKSESKVEQEAVEKALTDDPELAAHVQYVAALSPDDFITFGRLVVETRFANDQRLLRLFSDIFRRETK